MNIYVDIAVAVVLAGGIAYAVAPGVRRFFTKELHDILGGFHKVQAQLETYINRERNKADAKLNMSLTLRDESAQHNLNVRTAAKVQTNISNLLNG